MFRQRKLSLLLALMLILILLLAACGGSSAQDIQEPVEAAVAEIATEAADVVAEPTEPAGSAMQTYVIVPAESSASYLVDEEFLENALSKLGIEAGKTKVVGSTQEIEGQIQLNPNDLSAALGENSFTVDLSTLESDQDRRDKWIGNNGPTFNQFPEATFVATALEGLPDSYNEGDELRFQVSGDLTVHGVTIPVTFEANAKLEKDTLTGVMVTSGLISDFGIEPPAFAGTLSVADELGIRVEFTAVKQ